jgi:OTU domain-containing protein 6
MEFCLQVQLHTFLILLHPDFLSTEGYRRYCTEIANSALWGGQTEISALSKYFKVPIFVYQSDAPELKIGDEEFGKKQPHPLRISYHKKMYGLGEHYNSIKMAPVPSQDG